MKVIFLFLVFLVLVYAADVNILCTTSYCETYLTDNTCVDLPTRCTIQNSTHNGIFLPFAGPCNCCDYCIANLDEGDACAVGNAASPTPTIVCGDLLTCRSENDVSTCQMIETDCTSKQMEYDAKREEGTLGHLELRENCQRRGLFEPYKCIPGEICYCVSEEGERIFGEIPFTILASTIMACDCSRKYEKASSYMGRSLYNGEYLRCQSNGDYDPIQCVEDDCFCVHTNDGSLAINRAASINMTSISNETLLCFNHDMHTTGEYYRECEAKVIELLQEIEEFEDLGYEVFGYRFPNCQIDGYYAAVQENETHKYCADPHGNVLENFILEIDNPLVDNMNCKCARSRYVTVADMPECDDNGNYLPIQCRRGLCRCVDENGNQVVQEVRIADRDTLNNIEACGGDSTTTTTEITTEDEGNEEDNVFNAFLGQLEFYTSSRD